MIFDTICAIATPFGTAGISVIRVSGHQSIDKINQIFKGCNLTLVKSHTIHYGHILDEQNHILDEVMVSILKAPKTFTAEDTVEISTHGGILITQRVLERILSLGIRLAEPGEFSQRAYLNGRIDLIEAESIMDLIHAKNEKAMQIATLGIRREISQMIKNLRSKLLTMIAQIEVNIDYPEYDDAIVMSNDIIYPQATALLEELNILLKESQKNQLIKDGIRTAIIGRPNVGKSSLLNTLLDEEKAIVTDIAGTTRDTIEAYINVGGVTLNLIDTAGIRDTEDVVEKIGVSRSKKALEEAALVLLVLDQSSVLTQEDKHLLLLTKDKIRIIIANKSDLPKALLLDNVLPISTLNKSGIKDLEKAILKVLSLEDIENRDFNYLSNVRHIAKVREAKQSLEDVIKAIDSRMPVDLYIIDLTNAWQSLGDILGERYQDELLDELFSKFCLGK